MSEDIANAPAAEPEATSGMAIGSLVMGICGLVCVLPFVGSLLGVVLGHLSLGEIKRSEGRRGGRGLALGGLATGYLGLVLVPVAAVGLMAAFVTSAKGARSRAREVACMANLRQIGLSLLTYASDNGEHFPTSATCGGSDFGSIAKGNYITPGGGVWACPSATVRRAAVDNSNYIYMGSGIRDDNRNAAKVVIACDAAGNHPESNKISVLFADGHVEGVNAVDIETAAAENGWTLPCGSSAATPPPAPDPNIPPPPPPPSGY